MYCNPELAFLVLYSGPNNRCPGPGTCVAESEANEKSSKEQNKWEVNRSRKIASLFMVLVYRAVLSDMYEFVGIF